MKMKTVTEIFYMLKHISDIKTLKIVFSEYVRGLTLKQVLGY